MSRLPDLSAFYLMFFMKNLHPNELVDFWSDFIDWDKRRQGEDGFLARSLAPYGRNVLDACLGDGCDSIHLLKEGFDVTGNELDSGLAQKALSNARAAGVRLPVTHHDWRDFSKRFEPGIFDSVTLMGNSLTYLFKKKDQLAALSGFMHVLRPGGALLIDERNYAYMLAHREAALARFRYSKKYVYCGKKVDGRPESIAPDNVVMRYDHDDGRTARLTVYPFRKGELSGLLAESGFSSIRQFSDYRPGYNPSADFHQYACVKPPRA